MGMVSLMICQKSLDVIQSNWIFKSTLLWVAPNQLNIYKEVVVSLKILIADDEEDIRELLESFSRSYFKQNEKTDFFHVSDGLQALNSCFERKYDLILCDIKMPQMDGLSFLQALRNSKSENSETYAILVSGFMGRLEAKAAHELANTHLLEKPFSVKSIGLSMDIWMSFKLKKANEITP